MKGDNPKEDQNKIRSLALIALGSILINFIYDLLKSSYPFVLENVTSGIIKSSSFLEAKYYTVVVRVFFTPGENLFNEMLLIFCLNIILVYTIIKFKNLLDSSQERIDEEFSDVQHIEMDFTELEASKKKLEEKLKISMEMYRATIYRSKKLLKYLFIPFVVISVSYNLVLYTIGISAKADAITLNKAFRVASPLMEPKKESLILHGISEIKTNKDFENILEELNEIYCACKK